MTKTLRSGRDVDHTTPSAEILKPKIKLKQRPKNTNHIKRAPIVKPKYLILKPNEFCKSTSNIPLMID